jgi:hypothetical protein
MIKETLWLPLEEVIALYEGVPAGKLPNLVKARELPIWKEARRPEPAGFEITCGMSHGVE